MPSCMPRAWLLIPSLSVCTGSGAHQTPEIHVQVSCRSTAANAAQKHRPQNSVCQRARSQLPVPMHGLFRLCLCASRKARFSPVLLISDWSQSGSWVLSILWDLVQLRLPVKFPVGALPWPAVRQTGRCSHQLLSSPTPSASSCLVVYRRAKQPVPARCQLMLVAAVQ